MKVYLCFRKDAQGRPRLFHSYDEHEASQAAILRWTVPSLVEALKNLDPPSRPGEKWAMVMIDTDDPILADPQRGGFRGPIDFDKLIEADEVPLEICSLCQGDACEEGCGRGGKRPCRRPNDGPNSHRVCTGCGGKGRR